MGQEQEAGSGNRALAGQQGKAAETQDQPGETPDTGFNCSSCRRTGQCLLSGSN